MGCSKRERYFDYGDHEKDYDYHRGRDDHKDSYKPPYGKYYENCVEDVLEGILEAQKKVKKDDCCKSSCHQSINDLLHEEKKSKKDTIPFILYCDCKPFKGSGVTKYRCHSKHSKFKCVDTFVFKIKDLDKDCAVVELLTFKDDHKHDHKHDHKDKKMHSLCDQIDHKKVEDLMSTGICITVDLSCFCAISCLPAVKLDHC